MHPPGPTLGPTAGPLKEVGTPMWKIRGSPSKGGWGANKPPPWPTGPPHTEENVGHLLSTLVTGLRLGTPRINTFSDNGTPGKTEVSF